MHGQVPFEAQMDLALVAQGIAVWAATELYAKVAGQLLGLFEVHGWSLWKRGKSLMVTN